MEEMCVITIDFLAKLDMVSQDNLRVNIQVRIVGLLLYKTTLMILDTEQLRFARATLLVCGVCGILPVFPLARRRG